MATPEQVRRRGRWPLALGALIAALALAAVALADNTVADGDGVTPVDDNNMTVGNVSCGVPTQKTARWEERSCRSRLQRELQHMAPATVVALHP